MKSAIACAIGYVLATGCLQQAPASGNSESAEPVAASTEALNSVSIWGDPSGNQTITQGAGTVLTLNGTVKSTGTLAAKVLSGVTMVDQLATAGTGTSGNAWSGWEAALNALPPGSEVYFPAGYYAQTTTINVKAGWILRGAGNAVSLIVSSAGFTGDAIQSVSPYNGSTGVRLLVQDLGLISTNPNPTGAGIDIVAGTFINLKRVYVANYKYGAVLDQAEHVDIEECEFGAAVAAAKAGVWIVANQEHQDEHVAGVPLSPVPLPQFGDRIGIRKTQFNSISFIGIMDDGGSAHTFEDNNFTGGVVGVRLAGVSAARLAGNTAGWQTGYPIVSTNVTAQAGLTSGVNVGIQLTGNYFFQNTSGGIQFASGSSISLGNNVVDSPATAFVGISNVTDLTSLGNVQLGVGALYDASPDGLTSSGGNIGVQTANPGAELEVNGGMRLFTTKTQPICSAATRGVFWFSQGGINVKDSVVVCAKGSANNYLWRVIY